MSILLAALAKAAEAVAEVAGKAAEGMPKAAEGVSEAGGLKAGGGALPEFATKETMSAENHLDGMQHDLPDFHDQSVGEKSDLPDFGEQAEPDLASKLQDAAESAEANNPANTPEASDASRPSAPQQEVSERVDDVGSDGVSLLDIAIEKRRYINSDGLPKNLPKSDGGWTGEPGNSTWSPDSDYVPQKGNPDGNTWGEILDKYDIDGIPFNDGEPDFSEVAEAEVQVDEIGPERDENFAKADEALAEQWTKEQKDGHEWTAEDVRNYRKENHLTWHECGDRTTMQLVPAEVHSNVPHSGGVSAAKAESGKSESAESTSTTAVASDGTSNSNNANKQT